MKVLPEVVCGSEDTTYSVAYGNVVGLLIEAIKGLKLKRGNSNKLNEDHRRAWVREFDTHNTHVYPRSHTRVS